MVWHRPQSLLPPELVAALEAAHAGDARRALRLLGKDERDDALTSETVRLVRGLAAAETGDGERAQRLLRPLLRANDQDIALAATLASVEIQMERRGFARAAPWLQRACRHAQDEPTTLVLEASLLRLQLRRGGPVEADELERLRSRLRRHHSPAVHATLQLLTTEHALYTSSLATAARAERAARPFVATAQLASLRRWHGSLRDLLQGSPVALVDDWQRPRRAMTRAEIADLEGEPWQLWADSRHQKLLVPGPQRGAVQVIHFARADAEWLLLRTLLETSERRLRWKSLQETLGVAERSQVQSQVVQLQRRLDEHAGLLRMGTTACALTVQRFVHLLPPPDLPANHQRLLAFLAERPGTPGADLARALESPLRTVQRHLQQLRKVGLALIVGGGRDARYWAI